MSKPSFDDADFRKATASGAGGCVEVTITPAGIGVRDSKDKTGPVLAFNDHEWQVFLDGVRNGEFELPA